MARIYISLPGDVILAIYANIFIMWNEQNLGKLSTFLKGQFNDRQLKSLHINVFFWNNFGKSHHFPPVII